MFRRIAKEQRRFVESVQRGEEFSLALNLALLNLESINEILMEDKLLEPDNVDRVTENLVHTAKYRDATTKLNMHEECSLFSLIHYQTFRFFISARLAEGLEVPLYVSREGCAYIDSLISDIRYLAWGVKYGTITSDIFWEASDFADEYKDLARERLRKLYPDGVIPVEKIGDTIQSQSLESFCESFKDTFHYWVPPRT